MTSAAEISGSGTPVLRLLIPAARAGFTGLSQIDILTRDDLVDFIFSETPGIANPETRQVTFFYQLVDRYL